ncbi:glycosyltransferase family 2 protein [Arthrobacter sp. MI7-26]|uniref:glycosyltransferase family 2 protein n=1 Tax=Arthrobacter sp. MI7-26 TaxID=2993653 RepID=UPI002248B189|nr:glycosyltransferase family 2 protein [Arthrobacter sp. MI7-26]MCX2747648.1 glycosyltransferase family 2 protein [Arthrobacter sp. MI7-26]
MLKAVHVTAVVVSHDGGNYLPRTLAALLDQTRPADAAIGIDTGSRDKSAALLRRALGEGNVTSTGESKIGFGAAVMAGLARSAPSKERGTTEWIWLLHDDAAPAPEALAELLQAVERAPSVTVAGCKQLAWDAERKLIDAGLSTSRWAERLTLIEADELDQGQYDGRTDTFAVNSAGMLIRRDAWEQLGGFDPALPGVGDDVDFCWRNWLAGNRVVVVPAARMFHVENRPHSLSTPAAARKSQVHLRLTHASPWKVPLHVIGALLGGLLRLVLSILVKEPAHGISQLGATLAALGRPRAIWRARRNAARTRRVRRSVIKGLQTPRREVWAHRRSLVEAIGADDFQETQDSLAPEPSGDAGDDFAALATNERGWIGAGAVAAGFVALAASFVGLLGLLGAGGVIGGGLLPVATAADIWRSASSWWINLGAGLPGHGDPFAYVLWLVSMLGAGDSNAAIVWLLLLAMPLSGLGAWFAAGALTTLRRYRFIAALVWAGAPVLQVAVNQGRLGALLAHVVMPLLVLALLRATGSALGRGAKSKQHQHQPSGAASAKPLPGKPGINGTPSWTAAAAAGLALAVVTASAPSLLPPIAVLVVFCAIALGRRGRTVWWSLLPSAALFAPYVLSVLERPRAMLADPGLPLGFEAAPLWQQLLGQPLKFDINGGLAGLALFGPSGVPWALLLAVLVGAPVLLLSVAALFVPGRRSRVTRFLWAGALLLLAWAWLAEHVATAANGNMLVASFTGPAVSAAGFAVLGAALIGAENLLQLKAKAEDDMPVRRAAVRVLSAVTTLLLVAGPLASMGVWATQNVMTNTDTVPSASGALGTPRLIQPAGQNTLPATAVDHGQGPEQTRTLVITAGDNGGYTSSLMRGAGTTLDSLSTVAAASSIVGSPGQERLAADDDATASIRNAVATIVAGTGVDPRPSLEQLGAGFVVLKSADTAAQLTANRIDSVPGLVAVGKTDSGWLWRVTPLNRAAAADAETAHRVRVVDAKGAVVALLPSVGTSAAGDIPAGGDGRLVVLSERADAGWSAWLDGRRLSPTTSGWAQAFTLPAAGGKIEIRYTTVWEPWLGILQAVVIGLTILLAIPMPARRPKTGLLKEQKTLRKEYSSV